MMKTHPTEGDAVPETSAEWRRPDARYLFTAAGMPALRLGVTVIVLTAGYLLVTALGMVARARLDDAIPFGLGVRGVLVLGGALLVVVVGYAFLSAALRLRSLRYRIAADEVALRSGVLHQSTVTLPYARIHSVTTSRSLVDRMLGLTSLTCQTASDQGNVMIPGLRTSDAERIRSTILDRASGVDASSGL